MAPKRAPREVKGGNPRKEVTMAPKKTPRKVKGGNAPEEESLEASISSSSKETAPKRAPKKDVYRGSLNGLVESLKSMKLGQHMAMLQKTPFRHLFEAIHGDKFKASICRKSNPAIRKIMEAYISKTTRFQIGAMEKMPINEDIIRLIFDIIDGNEIIPVGKKETVELEFINRLYPSRGSKGDDKLTRLKLENSLKEDGITSEDFARLAVLYVLAYALAPTKGYSIGWYYTQFVEDVNGMTRYNWSAFIFDMLLKGMNKTQRGSMGCVIILELMMLCCFQILLRSFIKICLPSGVRKLILAHSS